MPDSTGENCGMWFRNLVIPPEMNISDANECLSYKM